MLSRTPGLCAISLAALLPAWGCGSATPAQPTPLSNAEFFESAGARLHFVLDLPSGTGPFPGIVIGAGSGRTTTSDGAAYVPFLLQRGFAVLRYDKRGVGQSTGTYRGVSAGNSESQIAELGGDMAAALGALAARPGVDAGRLGLMGTSQAGWVMVAAAERTPLARFTIAVTGSVVPIGVNIQYEDLGSLPIDDAYAELARYTGPHGYDPEPTLRSLSIPTLWLLGGQDRLVPTRVCVDVLDNLRSSGSGAELVVYPDEGHGLLGTDYWPAIDAFLRGHGLG